MLLQNAAAKGATVIEECRVGAVTFPEGEAALVTARGANGEPLQWRARFVVDASGRDTLLAGADGLEGAQSAQHSAAIFGHFTGARRLPGKDEGNITIVWFDNGWFWFIPLSDGTTSVGAVCPTEFFKNRGTDLPGFFRRIIASSPEIADRLRDAQLVGEVTATGNYSYLSKRTSGDRFLMVGDACAFIDPVFSTGVYLAMVSAFAAADAVEGCLREPTESRPPAAPLRCQNATGTRLLHLVHLPHPRARDAQPLHVAAQYVPRGGGRAVHPGRRDFRRLAGKGAALSVSHDLLRHQALPSALPADAATRAGFSAARRGAGELSLHDGSARPERRRLVLIPSYNTGARLPETIRGRGPPLAAAFSRGGR